MKMTVCEKIKTIDYKIEQNKGRYDLDRQTTKIFALSWRNVSKYAFFKSNDIWPEKDLLEKPAIMKRFEYLLLTKELKSQTDIVQKQHQRLDD